MARYILVDALNMFYRVIHANGQADIDSRVGMSMHVLMNSLKKCHTDLKGDHVVICCDGRSWRKSVYEPYKANRKLARAQLSQREQEDQQILHEAFDKMIEFFNEKTNCTVLAHEVAEADDLIALWIEQHPEDEHIIVSTDSDFYQLLDKNVTQYKGTTDELITLDGIFELKTNKKIKDIESPSWILFEKCVRGDSSDNIFSAYPGVRKKGTKNRVGIIDAYNDRIKQGYDYNNFMNQRWEDADGVTHIVREDFQRNKELIDLSSQPDIIKDVCYEVFEEAKSKPKIANVGFHFLKFCAAWELNRISQYPNDFTIFLNSHISDVSEEIA